MPGIAGLGDWLNNLVKKNPPTALPQPAPRKPQPQTIQPGVPLPTFSPQSDGNYSVQGLAPGASTFADLQGLGVLRNPPKGVVYFDPTGQAGGNQPHGYKGNYLAVPMQQPEFPQFEMMQPMRMR